MKTKYRFSPITLILICLILLTACFGSKKSVYVSPPVRTIPLDSVKVEIDPFRLKPEPDSFLVKFFVPGDSSCHVKIEFKNALHKVQRLVADTILAAGHHKLFWGRIDEYGDSIRQYRAYYYLFDICDSTFTRGFYYRRKLTD